MTTAIIEALRAIRQECSAREEASNYAPVSVRGIASKLNLQVPIEDILQACVDGGFTYCLDHTVEATAYDGNEMRTSYPSQGACYWGPDQLRSRLDCVDYRVYTSYPWTGDEVQS
jgi:hypothetical protein